MQTPRHSSNYSFDEVEALVEGYTELQPVRHKLPWLVRLCDIDIALRTMPPKEYQATLLIGLLGFDTRTAGRLMGASHVTMWKRYRRGLQWLTSYLNGGYDLASRDRANHRLEESWYEQ